MKPRMKLTVFLFMLFNLHSSIAQLSKTNPDYKRANIWYFGQNAGLDFSTNPPTPLLDGKLNTIEGSSVISDRDGELQFYTDGRTVWNKNHDTVKNGLGLMGYESSTQAVLIVNHEGNDSMFYIFTTPDINRIDTGLRVSLLNKNRNNGKGEIVAKNIRLLPQSTEKLTATKHQNGKDIWIVAHGFTTNSYFAFLLTKEGLLECPIESKVGDILDISPASYDYNAQGYLKCSQKGDLFANAVPYSKKIELFNFNLQNGKLKLNNSIKLNYFVYGLCFSKNNQNIYIHAFSNSKRYLLYYEIQNKLFGSIKEEDFLSVQSLQNTINGGVFVANNNLDSLDVISKVNQIPLIEEKVSLNKRKSTFGLPNFNQSYFYRPSVEFTYDLNCVENSIYFEGKDSFYSTGHKWLFENLRTNALDSVFEENHTFYFQDTGDYQVTYIASKAGRSDTISKVLTLYPKIEQHFLGKDTVYCKGENHKQVLRLPKDLHCFHWGDGSRADTFRVDTAGLYTATVTTQGFCSVQDTIRVIEREPIKPQINEKWDSLYSEQRFTSYQWYKDNELLLNQTKRKLELQESGFYQVLGMDSYGCSSISDSFYVEALKYPKDGIELFPNPTKDKVVVLFSKANAYHFHLYNSLGERIKQFNIQEREVELNLSAYSSGMYFLHITNEETNKMIKIIKQ